MSESIKVLMPLMGEGVNEATVIRWLKKPGDSIEKDDPILEVSTDKVDTEIPSPASGFLIATFADVDEVIEVDQVIAQLSNDKNAEVLKIDKSAHSGGGVAESKSQGKARGRASRKMSGGIPKSTGVAGVSTTPVTLAGVVRTSPLVRKMAGEHGIDLRIVQGTGLHGRITKNDVLHFIESGGANKIQQVGVAGVAASGFNPDDELFKVKTSVKDGVETLEGVPVRREKMSKIRALTADHMLRSVRTSPHVTTTFEIDLHNVVKHRAAMKDKFFAEHGVKLTFTPYFIKAAIEALKEFPEVNASIDGGDILYKDDINIGCAVAIDSGLVVPVLKKSQNHDLSDAAKALSNIVVKARGSSLQPGDLKGGTFSITNPGMYGCLHSQPIINQPQVAIMSVGAIVTRPHYVNDKVEPRPLCQVGLTFDHRLIDGEGGAKFLAFVRNYLENFEA